MLSPTRAILTLAIQEIEVQQERKSNSCLFRHTTSCPKFRLADNTNVSCGDCPFENTGTKPEKALEALNELLNTIIILEGN